MSVSIPVVRPWLPDAERLLPYLRRIDAARIYTNWGPLATELETRLAGHFALPDRAVVSASSGTAALTAAILATAGRATSERPLAILPAFTFVATAIAVEQCGFRPHLVDVDPQDWILRLDRLEDEALLRRTGVVVVVAPFGRAVAQEPCLRFRERTGIPVVIDGGGSFEGVGDDVARCAGPVPTTLSFHATKSFSTGEGGAVVTTDEQTAVATTRALNFGFLASRNSASASINGKMSEYHAAVGLAELDGWKQKRAAFASMSERYRDALARVAGHRLHAAPEIASCYILFEAESATVSTDVQRALAAAHIDCRLWYGNGVQEQEYFQCASREALGETERLLPRLIGLPVAPDLTSADIDRVATVVASALRGGG